MKIAVCVKAVPDAAAGRRIDPATKRLDRSGELGDLEWDTYAVEEALRLRERRATARWSSSRWGRSARSTRCARRSRWAPTAPCSSPTPRSRAPTSLGTAKALAGALERESADLVLFGQQSADGGGACLWAAVAERLRRAGRLAGERARPSTAASLTGKRQTEYGYDTIRAPLPAVVAVPTRSTRRAIRRSRGSWARRRSRRSSLAAGRRRRGEGGRATTVVALNPPPPRGEARKIEDDGTGAEKIVEFLAEKRLV